jgi:hypothetical protein
MRAAPDDERDIQVAGVVLLLGSVGDQLWHCVVGGCWPLEPLSTLQPLSCGTSGSTVCQLMQV